MYSLKNMKESKFFYDIGFKISSNPVLFIAISVLITALCGIGFINLKLDVNSFLYKLLLLIDNTRKLVGRLRRSN